MKRRTLLSAVGVAGASLAGCLDGNPRDATANTVERSVTEPADIVAYADLPAAEQQIARTAVEEPVYHACPDLPDALYAFSERFSTVNDSYLAYEGSTYGLWIRITDTIRVGTAPTPDTNPSCGLF